MRGKFGEEFDPLSKWNGKIVAEENLSTDFSDLVEGNIVGNDITGLNIELFQGKLVTGKLCVKKERIKKSKYIELKEDISLEDLFSKFQNMNIKMKIGYNLNFGQKG